MVCSKMTKGEKEKWRIMSRKWEMKMLAVQFEPTGWPQKVSHYSILKKWYYIALKPASKI